MKELYDLSNPPLKLYLKANHGRILSVNFSLAVQHWSARGIFDRRATLWGSWVVKGPDLSFWFAGDSGYCPVFTVRKS